MHFAWQAQYKRHVLFIRDVRRSGRWFPETGCILEHQICKFAKMILRDRCSTLDRWSGKIAKRSGTRPSALHSTFHFWRTSRCQVQKLKLPRRLASFWMLSSSKNEEVSQNCFVFDVVKFNHWGRLIELLRFWCCQAQNLRTSRRIVSFSRLQTDRQTDRQTGRQTDRHRQTQTDTDRHRQTQTDTDRHRQTQTNTDRYRHTQTGTDTHRHRQTQTDTDRHRQTETDRDRQRQTETDREREGERVGRHVDAQRKKERMKERRRSQPPVGPSVASLCHPWFTTTDLSYRFPIFETSATALRGTTGIIFTSSY